MNHALEVYKTILILGRWWSFTTNIWQLEKLVNYKLLENKKMDNLTPL